MKPKSFEEIVQRFGKPWESEQAKAKFEQDHMTLWRAETLETRNAWNKIIPIRKIYCNRALVPVLDAFFELLQENCCLSEIKTYDGCWVIRDIRGKPGKYSIHSFGLAIDFNAEENPLGGPVKFSPTLIMCAKQAGFTWGGDFRRIDGMHFQFAENC